MLVVMNNTKTNLAIAAIFRAVTLVVGIGTFTTTTTGQSAFAYNKKDNGKGNGNANTITIQKCKQAATQSGFDNSQDQDCKNTICTHPGENATCVSEGVRAASTVVTPVSGNLTCEQCFTKFLTPQQLNTFLAIFGPLSLEDFCTIVLRQGVNFRDLDGVLAESDVPFPVEEQLLQCLLNAGVHITNLPCPPFCFENSDSS
jgi:hypothetical protein